MIEIEFEPAASSAAKPPATAGPAEQLANELAHDLMSPYCPGRTLATCPSPQARKLEREILTMAEEGQSREQIETELVARFPDIQGYLGRPDLIYGTVLLALAAIVLLTVMGRRWARSRQATDRAQAGRPAASESEMNALDDALDRIDEF